MPPAKKPVFAAKYHSPSQTFDKRIVSWNPRQRKYDQSLNCELAISNLFRGSSLTFNYRMENNCATILKMKLSRVKS